MKRFVVLLFVASLLFVLNSCSHEVPTDNGTTGNTGDSGTSGTTGDSGQSGNTNELVFLDMSDAKNIFISNGVASNNSMQQRSVLGNVIKKIFKITIDGIIREVSYLNSEREEISIDKQPEVIYPINDNYFLLGFDYPDTEEGDKYIKTSYLVRKNDGAVFQLSDDANSCLWINCISWKRTNLRVVDNNLYFILGDPRVNSNAYKTQRIYKVDLQGINSLSCVALTPNTERVQSFDVDNNGNIIYEGYSISTGNSFCRIKKIDGGLANISDTQLFWVGLDGCIYYAVLSNNQRQIQKVVINGSNVSTEIYGTLDDIGGRYIIQCQNSIITLSQDIYSENVVVYKVYNSTGTPEAITLTGLSLQEIYSVDVTENFYYIFGRDSSNNQKIVKVNPANNSYEILLNTFNSDYGEIYSFSPSEEEGITFNALRMSDGKKIIGSVGINGGSVSLLDEERNVEISYLQRVR